MVEQEFDQSRSDRTILVVDDEKALAKAIAETLNLEGMRTIVAYDGQEALALARTLRPDLILLDVMMPGKSGIEVCATLKTDPATESVPVIFLTAKAEKADRRVGVAAGADAYLTKPFSPTELISVVREALSDRLIEPRSRPSDLSAMPSDQLVVYARELRELFSREREESRALQEARRHLGDLDRLKADFLSTVTHELLTPFASVGLSLEVLQQQIEDCRPRCDEALDTLATEIAGLHQRVKGVVKFAQLVNKRREPQPGYYSLDQVIPWAVQPVAVMARSREVDFRVLVPSGLPKVHADPQLLAEAVFQMAHNAVKFNLPEGRAVVRAFESKGRVVIEVSDTGVGLTQERLANLGRPFEQSANAVRRGQEGLGIGWAFVCYVAEVHDGCTSVESSGPGQGSIFSLALPAPAEAQGPGLPSGTEKEDRKGH